jgi:hypothetical protein
MNVRLLLAVCLSIPGRAQTIDTIGPGHTPLVTSNLQQGLHQYMIYMQDPAATKTLTFWYWLRRIDKMEVNGVPSFVISQHWYGADTAFYREVYSRNKASDFSPEYHMEAKRGKVFAYNWGDTRISGADTVTDNAAKNFGLDFARPNMNWNLDIETFEMLPLASGKTFAINFYDAGLDPPQYVLYKVSGSEVLETLDGQRVDCWTLVTEGAYNGARYNETYWISKDRHLFLKEEDHYGRAFRLKILMPQASPDLLKLFQASAS